MKSVAEIYNNGLVFQSQPTKTRSQGINEIEKQFNQIFLDLKANFPAITTVIKSQLELDTFKKQWLLSFAENGITTLRQIELGMKFARQQNKPYIISPGQFVAWCKEAMAQELGLPSVDQVMKEFRTYSAEIGFSCQTAEQFPWSKPVMYWIVTDLRKHMRQYNQSEYEIEQRAALLINKWAKKLSNGEVIPKIKVQIEHKPEPVVKTQYHETQEVKKLWKRIRSERSRKNG
ncbi:hypothetical protein A9G13_02175 [Gilliamella sp. wkB178]|uniref:replication protein P n=1 Tax=Gilliamella sp. wkB178 TaxID=3120259 RepID=UPI00080E6BE6|nr:replication protein P [Gilliamella apicola]OCG08890.1 hypothetical protein A9G13_02175 [Gilliamella apicola]